MGLIKKIREKGIIGICFSIKKRVCYLINRIAYCIYREKKIKENLIILESEGDLCDNAYALYYYMKHNGYLNKYKVVWLVDHIENYTNEKNVYYVGKDIYSSINLKTMKALALCKWYIYDHNNLYDIHNLKIKKTQRITYLCHGYAGFKRPKGAVDRKLGDDIINTGEIPAQGTYDFNGKDVNVQILGFSRLDWFYSNLEEVKIKINNKYKLNEFDTVILWMPTFRKSISLELSEEYLDNGTGLPLLDTLDKYKKFNEYLKKKNCLCILKLHHLQAEMEIFKENLSNILIVRDTDLAKLEVQLYQFIPLADALITDYSSVSTDYMLLNKPIIYILDDYEEYNKSRGVYPDNAIELMPGDHVYDIGQLEKSVDKVVDKIDDHKEERNKLLKGFHKYQDGNSSKRILDYLKIIK